MQIKKIQVGALGTNCYIIHNDSQAFIIDPGEDSKIINSTIEKLPKEVTLKAIIITHGHLDHIYAINEVYTEGVEIAIHESDNELYKSLPQQTEMFGWQPKTPKTVTKFLSDNEEYFGFKIFHTPGHSKGSICIYRDNVLFSGDTLFAGGIGRTDLWGGDFNEIKSSLIRLTKELSPDTIVYPGHGDKTTIGNEIKNLKLYGISI